MYVTDVTFVSRTQAFITMCWSRQYVFNLVRHPTPEKTNFNFLFTSGIRTWDPYQNPDRTHALNCSAMAPLVHKKSYNTKKSKFYVAYFYQLIFCLGRSYGTNLKTCLNIKIRHFKIFFCLFHIFCLVWRTQEFFHVVKISEAFSG